MSKITKTFYSVIGLLLFVLFALVAVFFSKEALIPYQLAPFIPNIETNTFFGNLLLTYIFWAAVVLMVFVLLGILGVLLYPRTYTEIELSEDDGGKLQLRKSAIQGYVETIVKASGYMKSPSVKVSLYKKKVKVKVSGKVVPRVGIVQKTETLKSDIQAGLDQFFGVTKKLDFTVDVQHIEEKKKSTSSRVE